MRVVSKSAGFKFHAQARVKGYGPDGSHDIQPTLMLDFRQGDLEKYELDQALAKWYDGDPAKVPGIRPGEHPVTRFSSIDTEQIPELIDNPELKATVEEKLRRSPLNEIRFFIPEKPRTNRPWKAYDGQSLEQILVTLSATGDDPTQVLAYEAENANRLEVIEAVTRFVDGGGVIGEVGGPPVAEAPAPVANVGSVSERPSISVPA